MSERNAIDPFAVKTHSKLSPLRIMWTIQSRLLEWAAKRRRDPPAVNIPPDISELVLFQDRGAALADTAVTSRQLELLRSGLDSVSSVAGDVVEVGCFRGVTTESLAAATLKTLHAVDPFIGWGGSEQDYELFLKRTQGVKNIRHVRKPSGAASADFPDASLCFAFIDAIHDVSNSWFDFVAWSRKLVPGGLMCLHDVDDHPGVGFTYRHIINSRLPFELWGYCPNLVILRKVDAGTV